MGFIYLLRNKNTNKVYIGQTVQEINKRIKQHLYCAKIKNLKSPLYNSIRKYGFENFEFTILKICDKILLNSLEEEYIKLFKSNNHLYGYNVKAGGNCTPMTESTKQKISKKHSGRKFTEKWIKNISLASKGKINIGDKNARFKYQFSNKEKEELCLKNPKRKAIKCIETNIIYPSIRAAAKNMGLDKADLSKLLNNKLLRNNIKGYTFEYVHE